MTFEEFTKGVLRTEGKGFHPGLVLSDELSLTADLVRLSLLMLDMIKKSLFYGRTLDREKFQALKDAILINLDGRAGPFMPIKGYGELPSVDPRLIHSILGVTTESGELFSDMMAALLADTPMDVNKFVDESGDVCYYQAVGYNAAGIAQADVLASNKAKLLIRYPDFFDPVRSESPDKVAELAAIEAHMLEAS